jgi:hypothetical protein
MIPVITKKISLILPFILFGFVAAAQKHSSFFIEAKGGLSFPVGRFANKNFTGFSLSNADGLAKTGFAAGGTGGYQFKKSFAAILSFDYSSNKQDPDSYDVYLKRSLSSGTSTSITTHAWNVFKIMGGGQIDVPFSTTASPFSFRATVQAGVCKTAIPGFSYITSIGSGINQQVSSASSNKINLPWAFCYSAGAGIKYKLKQKFYLLSECSYFNGKPVYKFSYSQVIYNNGIISTNVINVEKKVSLSSILIKVGIGLNFKEYFSH